MVAVRGVLIGNESLLIQCGEAFAARGHTIAAVVTRDDQIRAWAGGLGIRVESPGKDLGDRLADTPFDWLFSIANLDIIPQAVLGMAQRGAINFHDGPLPAYAGLNAPVWAILNGEERHGIAWHLIEGGIDEGDILAARDIEIAPNETALTLNTKCYAAAIDSFADVLDQIGSGALQREAQDLSRRSYFARDDRPEAAARLDFRRPAADLAALVRALSHGSYWNPLAAPKIEAAGRIWLVGAAEPTEGEGAPGTVLAVEDGTLSVAVGDGALLLSTLTDMAGRAAQIPVQPGDVLPVLGGAESIALTAAMANVVKAESFWRGRLQAMERAELAEARRGTDAPQVSSQPLSLPQDITTDRLFGAVAVWTARSAGRESVDLAYRSGETAAAHGAAPQYLSPWVPLGVSLQGDFAALLGELAASCALADAKGSFAADLAARDPQIPTGAAPDIGVSVGISADLIPGTAVTLSLGDAGAAMHYDAQRLTPEAAARLAARLETLAAALASDTNDSTPCNALPLLSDAERKAVLFDCNRTEKTFDEACLHELIAQQVDRTPGAVAAVFEHQTLTYAELDERANRVANALIALGVGPDTIVGLYTPRSTEMLIGALGILKAGGAYLPLDPAYPFERIDLYLNDSGASVVLTSGEAAEGFSCESAEVMRIDDDPRVKNASSRRPTTSVTPQDLAYVIYTSGSTGRPKGVMVEHRNVANFFAGMDDRITREGGDVWLAVTSLSFDISVLELFYTLARGFKVVIVGDATRNLVSGGTLPRSDRSIDFSLFYWGNDDGVGPKKYELLLEGAKFADAHGFKALWTPERHFHAFGGPYPNPSVTGAAVAAVTQNLEVRAGSCVAPLHHPARIAEEWAVIDNLTNGRTGLAIASGWQPDDFVLRPENTPPENKAAMFRDIETLRRLWRGEAVEFPRLDGSLHKVVTQPRPVSSDIKIWVTTAGNPQTWKQAGEIGANVLTHLLGQSIEEVGEKIDIYHEALRKAGRDPADHTVTLMLHTYLGKDREKVRAEAKGPMMDYLRSAAGLIKQYAWAFPAFKKPQGVDNAFQLDLGALDAQEMEAILEFAFERYFEDSGLFGTVEDALQRIDDVKRIGVDEVACLIDYGISVDKVLESLTYVADVLAKANVAPVVAHDDFSIAAEILRHKVSHLQCTPSMAQMIATNEEARYALGRVKTLLLGGEALPGALVEDLRRSTSAHIENMYGPTETTIWSSTGRAAGGAGTADIGTPIANTTLYVLDARGEPLPIGVPGELYIGGAGVTRGYLNRADLTAERFLADPFAGGEAKMYRTGDLVCRRFDGRIDFLGRADTQIKLRGYRIELGEIEAALAALPGVREAAVVVREEAGDKRLVGYVTAGAGAAAGADVADLRASLAAELPEHMIPAQIVPLDKMPLTPNGKIDRKALPAPSETTVRRTEEFVAPASDIETTIATVWKKVLGPIEFGTKDNFFEMGGHSLLAVQAHRELKAALGSDRLTITDIFRFPTLEGLAGHLGGGADEVPDAAAIEAAQKAKAETMSARRAMRMRRRASA